MSSATSIAAVIPCHNEGRHIAAVVAAVQTILPTIFVVDDGSTDATAAAAQSSGAQVLRFASNLGKGAALKTGLEHALATGF